MLYNHVGGKPSPRPLIMDRDEWGEGLGVRVSHAANLQSTPLPGGGGGGYGVLGSGGGQPAGQPGGTIPVAGTQGSAYVPVGRTTSPYKIPGGGSIPGGNPERSYGGMSPRRNVFQPTAQGSRVSWGYPVVPTAKPGKPGSKTTFPAGGLFDDVSGLGDFFGWVKQRFTPPSGGITKIQLGSPIARILPTPIRKMVRYSSAALVGTVVPVFTAGQSRQIFGLSAKESPVFETMSKVGRGIYAAAATIYTGGALYYGTPSWLAATPAIGAAPVGGSVLNVAAAPAYTGFGSAGYVVPGAASPAAFGGAGTALAPAGYSIGSGAGAGYPIGWTTSVANPASLPTAPWMSTGWQAPSSVAQPSSLSPLLSAPPSTAPLYGAKTFAGDMAAMTPKEAVSGGYWSWARKEAWAGTKLVGKSALDVSMMGLAAKILSPGMGPQPVGPGGIQIEAGGQPAQTGTQPQVIQVPVGGGGGYSGSSDQAPSEILAGMSLPMIVALAGIAVTIGVTLFKRKRK